MENLTIVIPYRNERAALSRLLRTLPTDLPAIVVDDCSETAPDVRRADTRLLRPQSRGYFSGAVNAGINACTTDVLVLNQDVWFEDGDGWLAELDGMRQTHAIAGQGVAGHPAWPKGYVDGRLMFLRRDALEAVGLLNARDWPLWGATCEWQARACRRDYKALPMPKLDWYRHEERRRYGASIEAALEAEPGKRGLFIRTPPLVTVVIPAYNHGRYLPDAIHSLISGKTSLGQMPGQTWGGFRVIVVDDGSTDDTPAVMAQLADPWKGVLYLRLDRNRGTAAAENAGVRAAFGRFVQVLGADDMLAPEALETLYRVVEAEPKAVPYSDLALFKRGKVITHWRMDEYDFEALLHKNMVPAGVMFAKAGWEKAGGFPEAFAGGRDDWAFAVALGRVGCCGRRVPQPLYYYRREGQNRTLRNTTPEWRERFLGMLRRTFPDLYERGERMPGCCGGSRRKAAAATNSRSAPAPMMAGEEGMVLIEYVGKNTGRTSWSGPVTHVRYTFSGSRRVGYVDRRDVDGMLKIIYDRAPAFRLYAQPAPNPGPEPEPKPEPVPEPEPAVLVGPEGVPEAVEVEVQAEEPEPEPEGADALVTIAAAGGGADVGSMSVRELRAALKSADAEMAACWLEAERSGKARKVALKLLEAAAGA